MDKWSTADREFMQIALGLARAQSGRTGKNPAVGCVIVKDDIIVGRGATADGGRPHAEALALLDAGANARGATAYVTLEPCAHKSERGPACAFTLVDAGISRLIACLEDPDPRTQGAGFLALEQAGIIVEVGLMDANARIQLSDFMSRFDKSCD